MYSIRNCFIVCIQIKLRSVLSRNKFERRSDFNPKSPFVYFHMVLTALATVYTDSFCIINYANIGTLTTSFTL